MRMKDTGNLYIEIAEKSRPDMPRYTPSGIYRKDNTFLYLVGDKEQAFLFAKEQLKILYENKTTWSSKGIRERETPTSRGFTFPIKSALQGMCIKHYKFAE